MNKTKRFCAIALAAMTAATALAACGAQPTTSTPTASQGGSTTTTTTESTGATEVEDPLYGEGQNGAISLKVWGPDAAQAILKEQCDTFIENMKPYAPNGITIEVVPQGEDVAATQAKTDITAAADVFGFACDNIDGLVKAGALLEVTGAEKDFVTANNSESSVAAATVDGKIYAYPETGDNSYILVYDKTVVSEEQAKTLEGTLEACKAANKKFIMDAGNGYYSCMFMFTGGLKINGLVDGVQQFTDYDEDKVAKTVVAFQSLFAEYKDTFMSGEASKVVDGFKSGTVGAGIDGSWNFSSAKSTLGDNAGFTILPTIKVGDENLPIINMFGYKLLGVNAQSKFPNTAIELAKFLTNEECQMARAEKLNWGPSNKVVAESDLIKNDAALSAILAQSANSVPQTGLAGTFWTPVGTLGSKIIDFDNMMDEAAAKELI
ncbi:MAG: extracellular solute-binding protein, partial [Clostridia bacterium]|nr:extracellular solute-binding protein [Clostridia bacterium]